MCRDRLPREMKRRRPAFLSAATHPAAREVPRRSRRLAPESHGGTLRTIEALGTDALELNPPITAFLHDAEERGHVAGAELEALQVEHALDEDAVEALRASLAAADVEIDETGGDEEVELDLRPSAPTATTDSPQL